MNRLPPPPPRYEPPRRGGARTTSGIFAFLTGLVALILGAFTIGEVGGILLALAALGLGLWGALAAPPSATRAVATVLVAVFIGGAWFLTDQAIAIINALNTTEGPVDPADEVALGTAERKLASAEGTSAFRIELTESEITAVIQDALAEADDGPVRSITVDVVDTRTTTQARLDLKGTFKSGDVDFSGRVFATLVNGGVQVEILDLDVGALNLPGIGRNALEDIIEEVADLNEVLLGLRADVQSIVSSDDTLVVTGTHSEGAVTSAEFLEALAAQATGFSGEPPAERLGPGTVNSIFASGSAFYLALGDSLAANVGVSSPRLGYVSRVHRVADERRGGGLGLSNLGVSGETSGTLIRSGQLDSALAFIASNEVELITIDIGANDLLGHLGSAECSADIDSAACSSRIDAAFPVYEQNIELIFQILRRAAPEAEIVFMTAYNPFAFGFESVHFERRSNEILRAFNEVAAALAADHGIAVADGFSPMLGTVGATTHMLDDPPDIHPVGIGYDVLAASIVDALR